MTATTTTTTDPSLSMWRELEMEEEMLLLHQRIEALLPDQPRKVVQFAGARGGEGTSTVVRALGRAVAALVGRSVLIFYANDVNPHQHLYIEAPKNKIGWNDVLVRGESLDRAIDRTELPNLCIAPMHRRESPVPMVLDGAVVAWFLSELRKRFGLVLVDTGLATRASGLVMSAKADGVVLVMEADRTRWPVALEAKQTVERCGGTVLGTVLNKRRFHVPEPVYRLL